MARSGCIVKALVGLGLLAAVIGTGETARAQTPAQPAPAAPPPRSAAAPTPAPAQPPAAQLAPPTKPAPAPATPAPATPAAAGTPEPAPATAAPAAAPTAPPPAAGSGEPVDAGTVSAPVVESPQAIPAPPPDRFAFPNQRPVQACPPGRCGEDCQQRCRGQRTCLSNGTCDAPEVDLGRDHKGLLLRVTAGWGFGRLSASKHDLHEPSFVLGMGVDVGAAVIDGLIVRGRVKGAAGFYSEGDFGEDVLFSFGTVGVGVDYYFMPVNAYVGGTISVAGITRGEGRGDEYESHRSKAGVGLDLDLGKEWWVGRQWGIGIAVRASYIDVGSANILRDPSARLRSFHLGLQLSATFN